jgi:hypothetical protein
MKKNLLTFLALLLSFSTLSYAGSGEAGDASTIQVNFPVQATYLPNSAGKSLATPSGWGASNNVVFIGAGGTVPAPYSDSSDGSIVFGGGFGDSVQNLGVELSAALNDFDKVDELSYGIKLHKYLGYGMAFAVGGEHLFAADTSDADESFYAVLSRASQNHPNDSGISKLHYSLGVGNGRFGEKSPEDEEEDKGEHGTYVFGSVAYEVMENTNVILEWTGINFNTGVSTAPIKDIPVVITVGLGDLVEDFSGDGVRVFGSIGFAHQFKQ